MSKQVEDLVAKLERSLADAKAKFGAGQASSVQPMSDPYKAAHAAQTGETHEDSGETSQGRTACEHDWRVNPFVVYTSNPPMTEEVCAECGQYRVGTTVVTHADTDPHGWPKAPPR